MIEVLHVQRPPPSQMSQESHGYMFFLCPIAYAYTGRLNRITQKAVADGDASSPVLSRWLGQRRSGVCSSEVRMRSRRISGSCSRPEAVFAYCEDGTESTSGSMKAKSAPAQWCRQVASVAPRRRKWAPARALAAPQNMESRLYPGVPW